MKTGIKSLIIVLLIASCNSEEKTLPVLSYKINEQGHKESYTITYNGFVNQFNNTFTTDNLKGKVFLANFFFTRCPSICPPMQQELIKVANTFNEHSDFMIVSHTIDIKNDTVTVLKNYWKTTKMPAEKWQFLRASEANTKAQSQQFMTNFKPNEDGTDFYHSSYVALVDKKQQIRGFYNTLVPLEIERLLIDIELLLD